MKDEDIIKFALDRLMGLALIEGTDLATQIHRVIYAYELKPTAKQVQPVRKAEPVKQVVKRKRKGAWSEEARARARERFSTPENKAAVSKRMANYWRAKRFDRLVKQEFM